MPPIELTPDGVLQGIPDPVPPGKQRVEEFMFRVIDAGPNGAVGDPDPSDQVVARSVHVRVGESWLIDQVRGLLPPDMPFAGRVAANTLSVGVPANPDTTFAITSPDFLNFMPAEIFQRVENVLRRLTALMNVYSPNTRRAMYARQVHNVYASGRQAAHVRALMATSATDGIASLATPIDGCETRSTILLRIAQSDGRVSEALSLLESPDSGWAAIYDVLKFVDNSTVTKGKKSKISLYRGTASWYRHLGEPGRPAKPVDAPSLVDARTFAFGLLQDWLELRVTRYLAERPR